MNKQKSLQEFLHDSLDNLEQLDLGLAVLENKPDDRECLTGIWVAFNAIRTGSNALGLRKLESIARTGELLVSGIRMGAVTPSFEVTSGIIAVVGAVCQILSTLAETGTEGDVQYSDLISSITSVTGAAAQASEPDGPELTDATIDAVIAGGIPPVQVVDVNALEQEVSKTPTTLFTKAQSLVVDGITLEGRTKLTEDHIAVPIDKAKAAA